MKLLTKDQLAALIENGRQQAIANEAGESRDFWPVVKLFYPAGAATWLLTEIDPDDPEIAFGLCDLGHGFPELGDVSLSEISQVKGPFGLGIERDRHWSASAPLSAYADAAFVAGRIVDLPKAPKPAGELPA